VLKKIEPLQIFRPLHPWTNGQVEMTNKIIKQAMTKRFHYENFEQLKKLQPSTVLKVVEV
jgi:hypothetical protein